jgi:two-component system response regulator DevR
MMPVRILIVDDSSAIRARLVSMMRELPGIDLDEASGADEALEAVLAHGPDVVVLDLNMPGKNGLEILPAIKAMASPPLVVVLTGHPTEHHRRLCLAQGADYFFDKSKDFARVLELLDCPTA